VRNLIPLFILYAEIDRAAAARITHVTFSFLLLGPDKFIGTNPNIFYGTIPTFAAGLVRHSPVLYTGPAPNLGGASPKESSSLGGIAQPTRMATIQPIAGENEQHPDVALVERVRAGDVSAYDELVRKYDRQVFRIAQHITQNREDAEDVMQDAFLKAYEKLDQFQGNSKFYTWLVRIAVNESLMRLRKRRTGKMVSIDEDVETEEGSVPRDLADWAPDPEMNYSQSELSEILEKTIKGLPPGFRVVFELRDVQQLSTEETAEALGLSIPAVKSRLLRARLQLRERLTRYFKRKAAAAGQKG
jgi:RNA polymerase sigma-70 factor (ECF subfamily)